MEEAAAVDEMLNDAYCHGVGFYQEQQECETGEVRVALQEMNEDVLVHQAFEYRRATILEQARAFKVSRGRGELRGGRGGGALLFVSMKR